MGIATVNSVSVLGPIYNSSIRAAGPYSPKFTFMFCSFLISFVAGVLRKSICQVMAVTLDEAERFAR